MTDIRTWQALAELTGISAKALNMRWLRGTLPLTVRYEYGLATFDRDQVQTWVSSGLPRKLQ